MSSTPSSSSAPPSSLLRSPRPAAEIMSCLASAYLEESNCDAAILCQGGPWIRCHKLVLSALSPHLRDILEEEDGDDQEAVISLPEFEFERIKDLVDSIYAGLLGREADLILEEKLAGALGLAAPSLKLVSEEAREDGANIDECVDGDGDGDFERRKDFSCKYCDAKFVASWTFQRHTQKFHPEEVINGGPEQRDSVNEENKQCPDCGLLLAYGTKRDRQRFKAHAEAHFRERFTCDCADGANLDANAKRRHILLVHSGGKYAQCSRCAYIGTRTQVRTHAQTNHRSHVCHVCGKTTPTRAALSVHMLDHRVYKCAACAIQITGRHRYARHVATQHTGSWPCETCGAVFKAKQYLTKHCAVMHTSDEAKPHRCTDCGKGFVTSNALKTHMMNVHIKARPYACRYGCGAAYNDSSNRGHHERKKHGGNFKGPLKVAPARTT